ncbi:MAG: AMP-binding protein [Pseudonocardiaceae bacterium]|nr:AMP-binding protein [Pseudonocardiaceae bacterium]
MAEFTLSPLAPASFLERSGHAFRDRTAIVDGDRRISYGEFAHRARQLAGALLGLGIQRGDRVAALCANSHVMLEMHNGVPMAGAALVPLNTRLHADELVYILAHCEASLLVATAEFADLATDVGRRTGTRVVLDDAGTDEYEPLLAAAEPTALPCSDELGLLAVNYTSGTSGRPKGVMYHHRGAYLQAMAMALHTQLTPSSRYLWTLPMFHCNGWCFTWAVTAAGGTHVCLRQVDADLVWTLIRQESISHLCAAPTVLNMVANGVNTETAATPDQPISVSTGGAPPTPALLTRLAALNMNVTHLYGLTETYGPVAINDWHPEWNELTEGQQSDLKARQGIGNVIADRVRVVRDDGTDVPADGESMGELACRGNDLMLGYYRDEEATKAATIDGWFRTGDLGVMHPDGYVEIRDRRKDIIVSGGENISSVEVERVLEAHPSIGESAVVAQPDPTWGEIPVAFITFREGEGASEDELKEYLRGKIARYKVPKKFVFEELPKTATGKIRKNVLRARLSGDE